MNPEMYKDAILLTDLPEADLRAGDIGTVVARHESEDGTVGYSVEFFNLTGETIAVVTVPAENLRVPSAADVPAARERKAG